MNMLTVQNINQYYGGSHILRDVSLQTASGKITVLLGRNGVGKTTLLKSLMGLVPIRNGSILIRPCEVSSGILDVMILEVSHDALGGFSQRGHEVVGSLT